MIGFGGRIRVMRGEGPVRPEGRKQVITHPSHDGPGPSQTGGRTGAVRIRVVRGVEPYQTGWRGRACRQAEKPMPEACAQL
jgi:hypothetical protein